MSAKIVGVVGLGRFGGGLGLTKELIKRGYDVRLFDLKPRDEIEQDLSSIENWQQHIEVIAGQHQLNDFLDLKTVYLNPALPWHGPLANQLREQGIELKSDLELFFNHNTFPVIAVTGTNGKSTCYEMLKALLPHWAYGGNRGVSVFDMDLDNAQGVILEISSFQLERLAQRFDVAVVTSFSPDHLDHHGDLESYRQAKERVSLFQSSNDLCVCGIGVNDWLHKGKLMELTAQVGHDFSLIDGKLTLEQLSFDLTLFSLPGEHHQQLLSLAIAAARHVLCDDDELVKRVEELLKENFPSLEHRQQIICRKPYFVIDDSKSTSPESTICALKTFVQKNKNIHLICGGVDKGVSLDDLIDFISDQSVVLYLIGEQQKKWKESHLDQLNQVYFCGELSNAIDEIFKCITVGDIILLSPGTSSYDQFSNYQERGLAFQRFIKTKLSR